jgi:integrase
LKKAKRTGEGPATLRDMAAARRAAERHAAEEQAVRARREKTTAELWERYSTDIVAVANKRRTSVEKARIWKRRIEPAIGAMRVNDVSEDDVAGIVRAALRFDEVGVVVGGKEEAGNTYRLLHHLFNKALLWKLRRRDLGNPLDGVDEPRVPRRERLLMGEEIGALLTALDKLTGERPQIIAAIRCSVYIGSRIEELLTLRWDYIRRDEMELRFPDTKSGFSRRPLSAQTLATIDTLKPIPGVPYVFRAVKNPRAPCPTTPSKRHSAASPQPPG